ncbi:hypothetical protein Tco_0731565 [Tanacetum coccineum]
MPSSNKRSLPQILKCVCSHSRLVFLKEEHLGGMADSALDQSNADELHSLTDKTSGETRRQPFGKMWYTGNPKDSGFELTCIFRPHINAGSLDTRKSTSGGITVPW